MKIHRPYFIARALLNVIVLLSMLASMLALPQPVRADGVPAGSSEYYLPAGTDQLWAILNDNDPITDTTLHNVITIPISVNNITVYYDHWENGYSTDAAGDEKYTPNKGSVLTFESPTVPWNPRGTGLGALDDCAGSTFPADGSPGGNSNYCYDGRDRIYVVGGAVSVANAFWPSTTGTVYASAWEVYPTKPYSLSYTIPVGEDLVGAPRNYGDFDNVYVIAQATQDDTSIEIDNPAAAGVEVDVDLDRGEVTQLLHINAGTTVTGTHPIQVQFITGRYNQNYDSRVYTAVPESLWDYQYYNPVPGYSGGTDVNIYIYNPTGSSLTINYEDTTGSGSFIIPAQQTRSFQEMVGRYPAIGSAVYLAAANGATKFWAIGGYDTVSANYNWGFSLIPVRTLTSEYYVGWAPGTTNLSQNGSPVFVTPTVNNTTIFVDYHPADGIADATYTRNRLQVLKLRDSTNDNTGMHIWANNPIAIVWGEDDEYADTGNPYIDAGYTVLPLNEEWIEVVLIMDKSGDPLSISQTYPPAQASQFTLSIATGDYGLNDVSILDVLPTNWAYVSGSTIINLPVGGPINGAAADPVIAGQNLTWNDFSEADPPFIDPLDMSANQTLTIVYQAQTTAVPATYSTNTVTATGTYGSYTISASDSETIFATSPDLMVTKTNNVSGIAGVNIPFTWTLHVSNGASSGLATFTALQTILRDNLPAASMTYGAVTVTNGAIPPGGTGSVSCSIASNVLTCTASGGTVTFPTGASFDVAFNAARSAAGSAVNPTGGVCQVDPNGNITESSEANNTCANTVTVIAPADLTVTKTNNVGGNTYTGSPFRWTIQVTNAGGAGIATFSNGQSILVDNLPAGLTYSTATVTNGATPPGGTGSISCAIVSDTLDCTASGGTVTMAANASFNASFSVTSTAAGTLNNPTSGVCQVDPNSIIPESNEGNNTCANIVTVTPALAVTKTSDAGGYVAPGDTITYTITITNNGTAQHNNIVVTDPLPTGTTYVSIPQNTTMTTGFLSGTSTANYRDEFNAQSYGNNNGTSGWNWTGNWLEIGDSLTNPITTTGNITVFDDGTGTREYVLRFIKVDHGGDITIRAVRQADLSTCTSATLTLDYRRSDIEEDFLVEASTNGTTYNTVFTVPNVNGVTDPNYIASGNVSLNGYVGESIYLRLSGAFTGDSEDIVYIDNVQIACTYLAITAVTKDNITGGANPDLEDGTPPDLVTALDSFDLSDGSTMTVTYDVKVDNPVSVGQASVINTVSVTSDQQTTPVEDTVTDTILGSITIIKDSDPDNTQDFVYTGAGPSGYNFGGGFTLDDDGEEVIEQSSQTFTGLAPGTYAVTEAVAVGWDLTGLVCSDGSGVDLVTRTATIDLAAGETVTCTFTNSVANHPPVATNNDGATATDTFTYTISDGYGGTDTAVITVTVTGGNPANLNIDKAHTGNFVRGSVGTFKITVNNSSGAGDTTGMVTVSDTMPAGLVPTAASGTGWNCTNVGQEVTCTRSNVLAPGSSYPDISVTVNVLQSAADNLVNTATVSGGGDPSSDSDSNAVTIISATLVKRLTGTNQPHTTGINVTIGEILTYKVTLTVPAGAILPNMKVIDQLDRGLVFVACDSIAGGTLTTSRNTPPSNNFAPTCGTPTVSAVVDPLDPTNPADPGRLVTFNFGTVTNPDLANQQYLVITYRVVVLDNAENTGGLNPTILDNSVRWEVDGGTLQTTSVDQPVTIQEPALTLSKVANPTVVFPGATITFTITVNSAGSGTTAFDVELVDTIPAGLTYLAGTLTQLPGGPTCATNDAISPELHISCDIFLPNNQAVFQFSTLMGNLAPGSSITNSINLAWTSLPGDPDPAEQSPYNHLSTERFYDPGDPVNVYGTSAATSVNVASGGGGMGTSTGPRFQLPVTGFSPQQNTELPIQPYELRYQKLEDLTLEIPSLGVLVPIVEIPITNQGWDLTWLSHQAGYLQGTTFPSQVGNSVITAHVYLADGTPGPFVNLSSLSWDDEIVIHAFGQRYVYRLRQIKRILPTDLSALRSNDDYTWLTLLTCSGYDSRVETYRYRTIIRAVLISVENE